VSGEIETINDQLVARGGALVMVMAPKQAMTPDEALRHAAWIVALAEDDASHKFDDVLRAVRNT